MRSLFIVFVLVVCTVSNVHADIQVSGTGKVEVPADVAIAVVTFAIRDTNLGTLAKRGQKKLDGLIDQIKKSKAIKQYVVDQPKISEVDQFSSSADKMPKIFEKRYNIRLEIKPDEKMALSTVQEIGLDNELRLGEGNRYRSKDGFISYGLRDYKKAYSTALEKAINDARSNAQMVAGLTGLVVNQVKDVKISKSNCYNYGGTGEFEFESSHPDKVEVKVDVSATFETAPAAKP